MEQKKLSKLSNDETIAIKPADEKVAVVILLTGCYQIMIMHYLLTENTYKKLDSCIDNKIHSNLLRFLRQHKMCFTESEWKFLNEAP